MPNYRIHFHPVMRLTVEQQAATPRKAIDKAYPVAVEVVQCENGGSFEFADNFQRTAQVDVINDDGDIVEYLGHMPLIAAAATPATVATRQTIVAVLDGGLVQSVTGLPPGMDLETRDYECEGACEDELTQDADGRNYFENFWPGPDPVWSDTDRAALARDVFKQLYKNTESFGGSIGMYTTYLLSSIFDDEIPDPYLQLFSPLDEDEQEYLDLLREAFPADHAVWRYVRIEPVPVYDDPHVEG